MPAVIVHGVGIGPWSVAALSVQVAAAARALVVHRAGYGNSRAMPVARTMDEHVEDLCGVLDRYAIERPLLCGIAGGATIALALALAHPTRVAGLVLHEPALGSLAPGVHALLSDLAHRVAGRAGPEALAEVLAAMVGRDAPLIPPATCAGDAEAIPLEVPAFARFAPSAGDLRGLWGLPMTTTVGEGSPPARRAAAAVLADLTGCRVVVVPGSAHVVQLDAPRAFAAEILALGGSR